ncbi:MAG: transposase zinc-binding domain-containing protein [Planctomycetota bacterium]
MPAFCLREVAAFLGCGVLSHGCARVQCDGCGHDDVVAFSCKGRGMPRPSSCCLLRRQESEDSVTCFACTARRVGRRAWCTRPRGCAMR